jgi:hypothetical protein
MWVKDAGFGAKVSEQALRLKRQKAAVSAFPH